MLAKIIRRVFIPVLVLAVLWPSASGYLVLLGLAISGGAIWGSKASRASKDVWQGGRLAVSHKVKYEN